RSMRISTGRSSYAWASTTWRASAGRASLDGAAPAPPRELSAARGHRARIRARDHGNLRAQRLGEDDAARGDLLGDLRRAGGPRRQGLDPPAWRQGPRGRGGGTRVPAPRARV